MSQCPRCHIPLGCSCSLRQSRDGLVTGCTSCIPGYDHQQAVITQQREQETIQQSQQILNQLQQSQIVSRPG